MIRGIKSVITRWLKCHLQRLDAAIDLKQLNSLVEDNEMLAENLQHWAAKERMQGREEGLELGREKTKKEMVLNLIALGDISDEQIAAVSGFSLEEIAALRKSDAH